MGISSISFDFDEMLALCNQVVNQVFWSGARKIAKILFLWYTYFYIEFSEGY